MSDCDLVYTWRGKDIETLTPEETKQALRDCMKSLALERKINQNDLDMYKFLEDHNPQNKDKCFGCDGYHPLGIACPKWKVTS